MAALGSRPQAMSSQDLSDSSNDCEGPMENRRQVECGSVSPHGSGLIQIARIIVVICTVMFRTYRWCIMTKQTSMKERRSQLVLSFGEREREVMGDGLFVTA